MDQQESAWSSPRHDEDRRIISGRLSTLSPRIETYYDTEMGEARKTLRFQQLAGAVNQYYQECDEAEEERERDRLYGSYYNRDNSAAGSPHHYASVYVESVVVDGDRELQSVTLEDDGSSSALSSIEDDDDPERTEEMMTPQHLEKWGGGGSAQYQSISLTKPITYGKLEAAPLPAPDPSKKNKNKNNKKTKKHHRHHHTKK